MYTLAFSNQVVLKCAEPRYIANLSTSWPLVYFQGVGRVKTADCVDVIWYICKMSISSYNYTNSWCLTWQIFNYVKAPWSVFNSAPVIQYKQAVADGSNTLNNDGIFRRWSGLASSPQLILKGGDPAVVTLSEKSRPEHWLISSREMNMASF